MGTWTSTSRTTSIRTSTKIPAPETDPTCVWLGKPVMCGPQGLEGGADVFYRNETGALVDRTDESGLADVGRYFGLGVVSADFDADGDTDLYVANDTQPNYLYQNDGAGRFEDIGLLAGAAYNLSGATEAGMGVDFGDPNLDGVLDLFVTNFSHETNTLYVGSSSGLFADETEEGRTRNAEPRLAGMGRALRRLRPGRRRGPLRGERARLSGRRGGRRLDRVSAGEPGLLEPRGRRLRRRERPRGEGLQPWCAAFGDLDDDGDIDVVLVNAEESPSLLRNDVG